MRKYLILVSVTEKDVGNDMRAVAVDDLVEQVGRIWQRVSTIPSGQYVGYNPDSLAYTRLVKCITYGCVDLPQSSAAWRSCIIQAKIPELSGLVVLM